MKRNGLVQPLGDIQVVRVGEKILRKQNQQFGTNGHKEGILIKLKVADQKMRYAKRERSKTRFLEIMNPEPLAHSPVGTSFQALGERNAGGKHVLTDLFLSSCQSNFGFNWILYGFLSTPTLPWSCPSSPQVTLRAVAILLFNWHTSNYISFKLPETLVWPGRKSLLIFSIYIFEGVRGWIISGSAQGLLSLLETESESTTYKASTWTLKLSSGFSYLFLNFSVVPTNSGGKSLRCVWSTKSTVRNEKVSEMSDKEIEKKKRIETKEVIGR